MKGIIFNLLESLASQAGCSAEAWELVAEFAAAEAALAQGRLVGSQAPSEEAHRESRFHTSTRTMLTCLNLQNRLPTELATDDDEWADDLYDSDQEFGPREVRPGYWQLDARRCLSGESCWDPFEDNEVYLEEEDDDSDFDDFDTFAFTRPSTRRD